MRKPAPKIIADVAAHYGLKPTEIMRGSTCRVKAWPRQHAMYELFVQSPHLSLTQIGARMGGMDHTTVLWGVQQHCERTGQKYEDVRARAGRKAKYNALDLKTLATRYGKVMEQARHAS